MSSSNGKSVLPQHTQEFYARSIRALLEAEVPFLVGGAYAFSCYTGIVRHTKDFDVFVHPEDLERAMATLAGLGCRTELTFPHWLAKAHCQDDFVDIIFSSGNGVACVDEKWFTHAVRHQVFGIEVDLCPVEEIIWSKSFIQERERFDGADIAHLILARGKGLDWKRLLSRYNGKWRVLFAHLVMFNFIYPGERDCVPEWVLRDLMARATDELDSPEPSMKICRGTLVSREQYLPDIQEWGYRDARMNDTVRMTVGDIAHWTNAIDAEKNKHA